MYIQTKLFLSYIHSMIFTQAESFYSDYVTLPLITRDKLLYMHQEKGNQMMDRAANAAQSAKESVQEVIWSLILI